MEISKVIFENSPIAILICDSNGNSINANSKFLSDFHYAKDDLVSLNINQLVKSSDVGIVNNLLHEKKNKSPIFLYLKSKENDILSRSISFEKYNDSIIFYFQSTNFYTSDNDIDDLNKLISLTLEHGNAGFWFQNFDNPNIYWDMGMRKIYEFDVDEIITNEKWVDHIHPVDRSRIMQKLNVVMSKNEVFNEKFRIITKSNKIKYIHSIAFYTKNSENVYTRTAGINLDITDDILNIQKLNEINDRLQISIDAARIGLWEYDYKNDILTWNDAMFDIFDVSKHEFKGKFADWEKTLHPEDLEYAKKVFFDAVKYDIIFDVTFRIIRKDNSIAHIDAYGKVVKDEDGHPNKIYGMNIDISESEIEKTEIIKNNKTLKKSLNNQTEFISNYTNKLKSPLNQISNLTELLFIEKNNEERKEYYNLIKDNYSKLFNVFNKFNDLFDLDNNELEISKSRFNIDIIIDYLENEIKNKIEENGLIFNLENITEVNIYNDLNIIKRILNYIIDNSIKYTKKGKIDLNISNNNNILLFVISDTGIGIDEENNSNVFEKLYQIDNEINNKIFGSGLGLTLAKELTKKIGGKIWFKSVVNSGTKFFIEIPIKDTVEESILVVEDNDTSYTFLKILLKGFGYKTIRAFNGKDAIEKFEANNIILILMDMKLPVLDGYEATRVIKNIDKNIPIIATTSDSTELLIKKAFDSGCDEHVSKPIKTNLLKETIHNMINKSNSN